MIQRKSPQHRERRLCHLLIQGGGRRQLNLGQVISWSPGDLGHSILTWKRVQCKVTLALDQRPWEWKLDNTHPKSRQVTVDLTGDRQDEAHKEG